MTVLFANFATTTLQSAITAAATSITVASADASRFPAPGANQWFPLALVDAAGNVELVRATARSGAVITVTRGQEGTTARAFPAGARVDLRVTAAMLLALLQTAGGNVDGNLRVTNNFTVNGYLLGGSSFYATASAAGNAHFWLRDDQDVPQGLLFWNRATDAVHLRRYAENGVGVEGELVITAGSGLTFNGFTVWNLNHKATAEQYRGNVQNRLLTADNVWAAAGYAGLSGDAGSTLAAGTYAPDFAAGINFYNFLGGNITLANPVNAKPGQSGVIVLRQDATGGRTVAFGADWKFANNTVPPMSTVASRSNVIAYAVLAQGYVMASVLAGLP